MHEEEKEEERDERFDDGSKEEPVLCDVKLKFKFPKFQIG